MQFQSFDWLRGHRISTIIYHVQEIVVNISFCGVSCKMKSIRATNTA